MQPQKTPPTLVNVVGLKNYLGGRWIHHDVNLTVKQGEIVAIIGGSGCGKTVLLRSILMLQPITAGKIMVFGIDVTGDTGSALVGVQRRWGVLFQSAALFSSLSVLDNVMFPLQENSRLPRSEQKKLALIKLKLVGLTINDIHKYPSELSGGMKKRVAMARAIALDPELVFLDEPTSGLDPKSAQDLDELILHLREHLGLTFIMVTHDIDSLWTVSDRVAFIGEGKVLANLPMPEMVKQRQPLIHQYFARSHHKGR